MTLYTPIFESIVSLDGIKLADAATFGIVWRFCQMDKGLCNAAPEKMADKIGVSTKTVRRSLAVLQEKGLIKNLTPNKRNDTHDYVLTDYAKRLISEELVGQNDQPEVNRLDKMTNQVGQNDQPRLVKMTNEESLLRDSLRESSTLDPLAHILQATQDKVATAPETYIRDQFFGYRDQFLRIYENRFPGKMNETVKGEVADLGYEPNADPQRWDQACEESILNWGGNGRVPLKRVIEVYEAGGTWAAWKRATYGNGTQPKPKTKYVDATGKEIT